MTKKKVVKKKTTTNRKVATKKSRMRTPPFPSYSEWSTSKFFSFIRSALRKAFTRWPPKYHVLALAKSNVPKNRGGRQRFEYECAICHGKFPQKIVEVDHIIPCGSLKSFDDLAGFVERMFCSINHLRVVCKPCHKAVTAKERAKK